MMLETVEAALDLAHRSPRAESRGCCASANSDGAGRPSTPLGQNGFLPGVLLAVLSLATAARAQGPSLLDQLDTAAASTVDAGAPPEPSLLDQLDVAAGTPVVKPVATPSPNIFVRAIQSLNPDMSVILDGVAGYSQRAPLRLSGDDPDLGGSATTEAAGFNMQEVEFGFQGAVDPYFRADVFLTIPNLSGLEVSL